MLFLDLPTELTLTILDGLEYESDIDSLARTSRAFHCLFNPRLYLHNVHHGDSSALSWGIIHGSIPTVKMALKAGASLDRSGIRLEKHPAALAVAHGRLEMLQLLVERGLDFQDRRTNAFASFTGIELGDKRSFVEFIEKEPESDPNALDQRISWDTLLVMAAKSGHEPIVRFLLNLSPEDPNIHPPVQWTMHASLSAAVSNGHFSVVELLVDQGACMDTPDGNMTLLRRAIEGGNQEIVQLLLGRGHETSNSTSDRMQLIRLAAQNGQLDSVRCFLHAGALEHPEPDLPLALDTLSMAIEYGRISVITLLLESFDYVGLATKPAHKACILCAPTACGQTALVRDLLEGHGYNPNGYREPLRGCPPPLYLAVTYDHAEIVELLLAHAADPIANLHSTHWRRVPPNLLWYAASRGYERIVTLLLEAGIDPNVSAPLEGAAHEIYVENSIRHDGVFQRLLDAGLNLGQLLRPGSTIANAVVRAGRPGVVRRMLDDLSDHIHKYTILKDALTNGREVFELFHSHPKWLPYMSADSSPPGTCRAALELAAQRGRPDLLQLLLDRGLFCYIRHWKGELIVKAARAGGPGADPGATLDLLIRSGAEVDSRYPNGETALAVLASENELGPVRLLLDRGADPLGGGLVSSSPLRRAAISGAYGNERMVAIILKAIDKRGVPWPIVEPHVLTALGETESRHRTKVAKTLRQYAWRRRYPVYHVQCCQQMAP